MRGGIHLPAVRGVLLALLTVSGLFALDPDEQLTQYKHTTWTLAQGLPQDTIRSIAQTDDGYLWVGTNEGLARFDGYDFVTFTRDDGSLPNQRISKLWAGRNGNLWIGTMGDFLLDDLAKLQQRDLDRGDSAERGVELRVRHYAARLAAASWP